MGEVKAPLDSLFIRKASHGLRNGQAGKRVAQNPGQNNGVKMIFDSTPAGQTKFVPYVLFVRSLPLSPTPAGPASETGSPLKRDR